MMKGRIMTLCLHRASDQVCFLGPLLWQILISRQFPSMISITILWLIFSPKNTLCMAYIGNWVLVAVLVSSQVENNRNISISSVSHLCSVFLHNSLENGLMLTLMLTFADNISKHHVMLPLIFSGLSPTSGVIKVKYIIPQNTVLVLSTPTCF